MPLAEFAIPARSTAPELGYGSLSIEMSALPKPNSVPYPVKTAKQRL